MRYAVIYTVDTPKHLSPDEFVPPEVGPWHQTEDDSNFETPDEFAGDKEDLFGWAKGHHRKFCADLDEHEFVLFLRQCDLYAVEGEASILGFGGMTRAVTFQGPVDMGGRHDDECRQEAYVTPHCETEELQAWLREYGQRVPVCLTDSPRQRYLFRGQDQREPFQAVSDCLLSRFG